MQKYQQNFLAYEKTNIQKLTQTYLYTIDKNDVRKFFNSSTPKPKGQEEYQKDTRYRHGSGPGTGRGQGQRQGSGPGPDPNSNNDRNHISQLEQTIKAQENELNSIRNALIKAEEEKKFIKNKMQREQKELTINHDFDLHRQSNKARELLKSDSLTNKVSKPAPTKPTTILISTPNETQIQIKQAKIQNLSLIKSRPVIEYLTNSYKTASLKDTKYKDIKQDLLYKDAVIDRYKAQHELMKISLYDSNRLNEVLDEKLAQEECNRLLLTHSLNLCNLRAKLYDLCQVIENTRLEAVLAKAGHNTTQNTQKSGALDAYKTGLKQAFSKLLDLIKEINNKITNKYEIDKLIDISDLSFKNFHKIAQDLKNQLNNEIIKLEKLVEIPEKEENLQNAQNAQNSSQTQTITRDSVLAIKETHHAASNIDPDKRKRDSLAAAPTNESRVELAVLYEEIALLKEQLAHSNTTEGQKLIEKSATFDDLKVMDPNNPVNLNKNNSPSEILNQLAEKSNLLEEASKREEKLKDSVHDLKNVLKRLQRASSQQKAYSDKFIADLKRENRMLLESLSRE